MLKFLLKIFNSKKYKMEDFDLNEKTKLQFIKIDNNKYQIEFFHPLYKEWWILPQYHRNAWIHMRWNLLNEGSHGAYGLYKLTCKFENIEQYMKDFETINDVKIYLEKLETKYEEYMKDQDEMRLKEKNYPNKITN